MIFLTSLLALLIGCSDTLTVTNYTSETGNFASPNYGATYPANSSYRWYISESVGKYIVLTFDTFHVEGYANAPCKYDWVVVVEGDDIGNMKDCTVPPTGTVFVGLFCNYHSPPTTLALNSNTAAIQFCSDAVIEDTGFQISWKTVDTPPMVSTVMPTSPSPPPPTYCGFPFKVNVDQKTNISSPNFPPGPYPPNSNCTWNVTSTAPILKVTTSFFDVEGYSNSCYYDRLTITDQYNQSTVYCRNVGPNVDFSGTPPFNIFFTFVSDDEIQFPGFELWLTGESSPYNPVDPHCNETFTLNSANSNVTLYSPGWPYDYRNNEHCTWTIVNSLLQQNYFVQFLFLNFDTEVNFDQLTVAFPDGISKTYDGQIPKNNTAVFPAANLTATFKTDDNIVKSGFQILVTLVPTPATCPPQNFRCRHLFQDKIQCIPMSQFCDGTPQCDDHSDESAVVCRLGATCGTAVVKPNINVPHGNVFIVNGTQAKPFSWPWMVGIYGTQIDNLICGGTLIEPRWVLTSARCLIFASGNPYEFVVKAASYEQHSTSKFEQVTNVTSLIIHPKFNKVTFENDIALMLLDKTLDLNNYTNVACLPTKEFEVPANSKCVITGWGATLNTGNNTVLRQMLAYIIPETVCNGTDYYNGDIHDSQICAGDDRGFIGICANDFGGPLSCPDANDRYYVQGVASQNDGRLNCVAPHKPGIFSRTSVFMDFILETMEEYNKL